MRLQSFVISAIILAVLAASIPMGCSTSNKDLEEITLQINWYHEAEFVGYYMADAKGFYEDENISVNIIEGGPQIAARNRILDGQADFAIASFGEQQILLEAHEPSVAVMTVFQIPPLVMFSLAESGINEPKDMIGKRIGIKNSYWQNIAHETLINAGVELSQVIEVPVDPEAKELLYNGDVDIWMGYAHDEPIEAQVAGYEVKNIYPADYGVGGYEGLLLVNQITIDERSDTVERFVHASQRGWQYAVEHPDESADVMLQWQPRDSIEYQELAVRALIPLVDVPQAEIGWIDADRWEQLMGTTYSEAVPGYTMRFMETIG